MFVLKNCLIYNTIFLLSLFNIILIYHFTSNKKKKKPMLTDAVITSCIATHRSILLLSLTTLFVFTSHSLCLSLFATLHSSVAIAATNKRARELLRALRVSTAP